jgi:hypothetical protein
MMTPANTPQQQHIGVVQVYSSCAGRILVVQSFDSLEGATRGHECAQYRDRDRADSTRRSAASFGRPSGASESSTTIRFQLCVACDLDTALVEITESDEMFLRYSTPLTEISSIAAP